MNGTQSPEFSSKKYRFTLARQGPIDRGWEQIPSRSVRSLGYVGNGKKWRGNKEKIGKNEREKTNGIGRGTRVEVKKLSFTPNTQFYGFEGTNCFSSYKTKFKNRVSA